MGKAVKLEGEERIEIKWNKASFNEIEAISTNSDGITELKDRGSCDDQVPY